jgi:hypothetical protein
MDRKHCRGSPSVLFAVVGLTTSESHVSGSFRVFKNLSQRPVLCRLQLDQRMFDFMTFKIARARCDRLELHSETLCKICQGGPKNMELAEQLEVEK